MLKMQFRLFPLFLLTALAPFAAAADWQPVPPELLSLDKPRIDATADAEVIFWDVKVEDQMRSSEPYNVLSHYIRIKIFTEHGRDSQSTIDLSTVGRANIHDLSGRTILPGGRIVPLEKSSVFQRDVVKARGLRAKTWSFSMPSVEVGSVIEYQWREFRDDRIAMYLALEVQKDIPVWHVRYSVKPLSIPGLNLNMRSQVFQLEGLGWKPVGNGFHTAEFRDIPAFREEPDMPPEDQVKRWILLYYVLDNETNVEKIWEKIGRDYHRRYEQRMKPDKEIKRIALQLSEQASDPAGKLAAIYKFCRDEIKNIQHRNSNLSPADLEKYKPNLKPSDTLKKRVGTGPDINLLFLAMATAAGFEAYPALLPNRNQIFFHPNFGNEYFLDHLHSAVRVGDGYIYYDPSDPYLDAGALRWQHEAVMALIANPKKPEFAMTPLSPPEKNRTRQKAQFELKEDGSIEGEIEVSYEGHEAYLRRSFFSEETEEDNKEQLQKSIRNRFSTAEVLRVSAAPQGSGYNYSYRVKIPGYAQLTGRRLLLLPSYFNRNFQQRFKTSVRTLPVYFNYPWSESEEVHFKLPPGYQLDSAESPGNVDMGAVGKYETSIGIHTATNTLVYKRQFQFGDGANILLPAESYGALKRAFDAMHKLDNHIVPLKQGD